jgi:hypothetical protein
MPLFTDEEEGEFNFDDPEVQDELTVPETNSQNWGIESEMYGWGFSDRFDPRFDAMTAMDDIDRDLIIPFSEDFELDEEFETDFE